MTLINKSTTTIIKVETTGVLLKILIRVALSKHQVSDSFSPILSSDYELIRSPAATVTQLSNTSSFNILPCTLQPAPLCVTLSALNAFTHLKHVWLSHQLSHHVKIMASVLFSINPFQLSCLFAFCCFACLYHCNCFDDYRNHHQSCLAHQWLFPPQAVTECFYSDMS